MREQLHTPANFIGKKLSAQSAVLLDFVEAENSTRFHAPQEAARILGESVDFSRKGQIALRDGRSDVKPAAAKK